MWADHAESSHLVSPERLRTLVEEEAGFEIGAWNDLTATSIEFMRAWQAQPTPALGLQVFVPDFEVKLENYLDNLEHDRAKLIQAVLVKPA
jgi:hypothetical protein